jgi:3-dehydroquinate synthase
MKQIEITGNTGRSVIMVGESIGNLGGYLPVNHPVIITDSNVRRLYGDRFPTGDVIEVGTGEKVKNLETIQYIYERLLAMEADRASFIVGIGGGVVCDIAGFAASTYMRGMRFGFVSTTLLAQVDASVGGKNGVNFGGYKNMIGVFNQPEFVICDLNLLKTLGKVEVQCGFAEIVKHAAIADAGMFAYLEKNVERALALDLEVIEKLVHDSVIIKSTIVNRDEKEQGERRKLNFGHTYGHAVEKVTRVPHGHAVSIGMVVASRLSVKKKMLTTEHDKRLVRLLERFELPTCMNMDFEKACDALNKDKKRVGDHILFVLLDGIGNAVVDAVPISELRIILGEERSSGSNQKIT